MAHPAASLLTSALESSEQPSPVRVLIVAYYLPKHVTVDTDDPEQWSISSAENGNVGLFNAMDSVHEKAQIVCIGYPGSYIPESVRPAVTSRLATHNCLPVYLSDSEVRGHYVQFCKQTLWPLFHYSLPDYVRGMGYEDRAWKQYCQVNKQFADAIINTYQPGDIVWIHDYHLMLVPQLVRQRQPDAMIGFFLHVPFPSSELFRCLHVRGEILNGVLGADLVGFQTYSFARHFLQTCSRILGHDTTPSSVHLPDAIVSVGIFPIGIDFDTLMQKRDSDDVKTFLRLMKEKYSGKKVLIGRDKLDYIKGVPHKLLAFELFLKNYPVWRGKVILIQVATVTSERRELESQVNDLVNRINGKYGSLEYTPVVYLHQNIPTSQYLALLSLADACLITSLRDGMNLTSHEYVGCQKDNYSPLILSEFAGTYGSLAGAIRVNPWHYKEVCDSIHEALSLPLEEKMIKHAELFRYISTNTAQFWANSFIREIQKIASPLTRRFSQHQISPRADLLTIVSDYLCAQRRLLVFGYEGALTEFSRSLDLDASAPSANLLALLRNLSSSARVSVVSARPRKTMDAWFGHIDSLVVGAESGCFCKMGGEWFNMLSSIDLSWKSKVLELFEYYTERTEGSIIEKKEMSVSWHYRGADQNYGNFQATECFSHLESAISTHYPVHITQGWRNLEVTPSHVNKSSVIRLLLSNPVGLLSSPNRRASNMGYFASSPPSSSTSLATSPSLSSFMNAAILSSPAAQRDNNHHDMTSSSSYDFILCIGGDKSDEAMFEFFNSPSFGQLVNDPFDVIKHVCCVGPRASEAASFFQSTRDVIVLLTALAQLETTTSAEEALARAIAICSQT